MKAQSVQRIENCMAVQYTPGDTEAEAIIRGWAGLSPDTPLHAPPGCWVVQRRVGGEIYLVADEDFKQEFVPLLVQE